VIITVLVAPNVTPNADFVVCWLRHNFNKSLPNHIHYPHLSGIQTALSAIFTAYCALCKYFVYLCTAPDQIQYLMTDCQERIIYVLTVTAVSMACSTGYVADKYSAVVWHSLHHSTVRIKPLRNCTA
jgi:hypothetical protein